MSLTFMAKFAADRAGSSCHIHFSLWRDGKNAFAGDRSSADARFGGVSLVPRRLDRARARCDGVLRSDDQLVQALRGCFLGADAARLELRQPHRRISRRRQRGEPAHSNAPPRRRLQSLLALAASLASGLEGIAARLEPPECFVGDVYRGEKPAAVPLGLGEASSGRQERIRAAAPLAKR